MSDSLSASKRHTILFNLGLAIALGLLLVGVFSPMLTMSKFYIFENSFSVAGGIVQLVTEGKWLLALIILLFSVLLPLFKLLFLFLVSRAAQPVGAKRRRYLQLMHDYGRWAMLDVMVVAVLIVTVKLGAVASVEVHWGLYVFAAAVGLIMWLTHTVVRQHDDRQ